MHNEDDMKLEPIKKIMAVWDNDADGTTLSAAAKLADRYGATLTLFSCVRPPDDLAILSKVTATAQEDVIQRLEADRHAQMLHYAKSALPERDVRCVIVHGKPFIEIIRHVIREEIDLVIKTASPLSGVQTFLFGSTDQHLVRKCPCPVWLHMANAPSLPKSVIAAVDVDDWDAEEPETLAALNYRVIEKSLRVASSSEATVHVLHAWEADFEGLIRTFVPSADAQAVEQNYLQEVKSARKKAMSKLLEPFEEETNTRGLPVIVPHLVEGNAREVIPQHVKATKADAVVMGTVARTGLSGVIIGNTAEDILNNVDCSVIAVKPPGFVSPIPAQ